MTQLLNRKEPVANATALGNGRRLVSRMVAVGALTGVLGGWMGFEVVSDQREARRQEAIVARSQAMDEFYGQEVEAGRLERLIARSRAMDEFYGSAVETRG